MPDCTIEAINKQNCIISNSRKPKDAISFKVILLIILNKGM